MKKAATWIEHQIDTAKKDLESWPVWLKRESNENEQSAAKKSAKESTSVRANVTEEDR